MTATPAYSVITPTAGRRPKALAQAIDSVRTAMDHAGLADSDVEMLVGYDGVPVEKVRIYPFLRYFSLPHEGNFGNAVRHTLIKASRGRRLILLDDDNMLLPEALSIYGRFPDAEMVIARIDVSRAFPGSYLPVDEPGKSLVRLANIDPLCLCLSRELVVTRCDGWVVYEGYESDYKNIIRYHRRARPVRVTEEMVGVYDAGMGLDPEGLNFRQHKRNKSWSEPS